MVRACTPKSRFARLREAASAKAGHAGVGALRAWALVKESLRRLAFVNNLSIAEVNMPMDDPV